MFERAVRPALRRHFVSACFHQEPEGLPDQTAFVPDAFEDLVWSDGKFLVPAYEILGARIPLDYFSGNSALEWIESVEDATESGLVARHAEPIRAGLRRWGERHLGTELDQPVSPSRATLRGPQGNIHRSDNCYRMSKQATTIDLALNEREPHVPATRWVYEGIFRALRDGRLKPGTRLPSTRELARMYKVSRGTVIAAFEQLQIAGYLRGEIGAGTWVTDDLLTRLHRSSRRSLAVEGTIRSPLDGLVFTQPARPFRCHEPALDEFPMSVWARLAGRSLRRTSPSVLSGCDRGGYVRLRELVAEYLGLSRAVACTPDRIVIVSGVQQALDLLARLLLKPGDAAWLEDPGYFGAAIAFRNALARIVPVPVDEQGISVAKGRQLAPRAKLVYVTPSHQFPLGMTMSAERRRALLDWARKAGGFIVEDDYDSEYRFEGRPVPTLHTLDPNDRVILVGTFNKILFPAVRLGYIVVPEALMDSLLALRCGVEWQSVGLNQVVLSEFIVEGHLVRHLRRMRDLYGQRLAVLQEAARRHLDGLVETPNVHAGLYTVGLLRNGMTSRQAELAAAARNIESIGIDRFTLKRTDMHGIMLGFAAFDESRIRRGVAELAKALESARSGRGCSVVQNTGC